MKFIPPKKMRHLNLQSTAENPYAVEIVFLDENNHPKTEVFPLDEINASERNPFKGIDLFDDKDRPGSHN